MSRAFRDTFKQTICFPCQKFDRRESIVSFAQVSMIKRRHEQLPPSPLPSKHSTNIPLLDSNGLEGKNNGCES